MTRKTRMISATSISPKLVAAVATAVVTYLVGQEVLDLPTWAEVAGQAVLVGLAAYAVRPGQVVTDAPAREALKTRVSERGLTTIELLAGLTLVCVVALLLIVLT